jgi:hypothetical protein
VAARISKARKLFRMIELPLFPCVLLFRGPRRARLDERGHLNRTAGAGQGGFLLSSTGPAA